MPNLDSMSRRDFLKLSGSATVAAGVGVATGLTITSSPPQTDYRGVPDQLKEGKEAEKFSDFVESNYDVENFDPSVYDIIIDARYVEGEKFTDQHAQDVEEIFGEAGFELKFLEYNEKYPRENFHSQYETRTEDILGSENSLYTNWVEDIMKEAAVQVFYTPGKETEWGEKIINGEERTVEDIEKLNQGAELGANAVALKDRAAVVLDEYAKQSLENREGNPDMKLYKSIHEIGHTLGLNHVSNKGNIMYEGNLRPGRQPNFSTRQIEQIEEQLEKEY